MVNDLATCPPLHFVLFIIVVIIAHSINDNDRRFLDKENAEKKNATCYSVTANSAVSQFQTKLKEKKKKVKLAKQYQKMKKIKKGERRKRRN